jgi:molybdate transport system ATP-binding protein
VSLQARLRVERAGFTLDADVHADAGEVLGVLGPNGAGKSTLLRALAGLVPLTAGRVELAGEVIEDPAVGRRLAPQDRRIGMVFQDYRLFPHLSARENVAFGLRSAGTPKAEARCRADSWLARLGLTGLEGRRPNELSGGQAQRVALARALSAFPRLLLMDEPLAALDVATRAAVRSELRGQLALFPGPALLVTHDSLDALTLADRLLILDDGRVIQAGPAAAIAQRPGSPYVAKLVGLNLLRGTAAAGVIQVDGGGLLVTGDSSLTGPALAVLRPSSVLLQTTAPHPSSARNVWPGRLAALETIGDRVRVTIASAPQLLADVTPQAVAEMRLSAGDDVWVSVKATDIDTYPDIYPGLDPEVDESGGART